MPLVFDRDCMETIDCHGEYGHFNNILPVYDHNIPFHLFVLSSISFITVMYFPYSIV